MLLVDAGIGLREIYLNQYDARYSDIYHAYIRGELAVSNKTQILYIGERVTALICWSRLEHTRSASIVSSGGRMMNTGPDCFELSDVR